MSDDEYEAADPGQVETDDPSPVADDEYEAADDGDPAPGQGVGPSGTVHARGRRISDATRAAFAKAAASIKAQRDQGDDDEAFGGYDEGDNRDPAHLRAAEPEAAAKPPEPALAAPAPVAPAPSLDPALADARSKMDLRQASLDEREKKLAALEASSDFATLGDQYTESRSSAMKELVKRFAGVSTDAEVQEEIADLITELSGEVLGVQLPPEVRAKIDSKRATRVVKTHMAKLTKREAELAAKQKVAEEQQVQARVIAWLGDEVRKPDVVAELPWLAAEANAADLIYEVFDAQMRRDGTQLPWKEAAKRANDYIQKQAVEHYDKRRHLLNASPGKPGEAAGGKTERVQGDPQGIRRSHPHTNAAADSTPPTPVPPVPPAGAKWRNEDHRAQTKAKMRAAFRASSDE